MRIQAYKNAKKIEQNQASETKTKGEFSPGPRITIVQGLFELLGGDGKLLDRDEAFTPCVYSICREMFLFKALYLCG